MLLVFRLLYAHMKTIISMIMSIVTMLCSLQKNTVTLKDLIRVTTVNFVRVRCAAVHLNSQVTVIVKVVTVEIDIHSSMCMMMMGTS